VAEPGDADALAKVRALDAGPDRIDAADNFVAGDNGYAWVRELAVEDMQIGAADPAGRDAHPDFAGAWAAVGKLGPFEGGAWRLQYHRVHGAVWLLGLSGCDGGYAPATEEVYNATHVTSRPS
jgi:hypothetical protein